jgi:uncharacterized lipoprotein YmbA
MNDLIRMLSILLLITLLLTGCADHPVTRFHILTPSQIETAQIVNTRLDKLKTVGIRKIKLPAYLDRPQIVKRIGNNELVFSSSHQWGEPLSQSVARVLTKQLDAELVNVHVRSHSWSRTQAIAAQIDVRINQFEIVDDLACVLDVNWLIWPQDNKTVITHHSLISVPVDSHQYSALATAHSQALSQLSKQIASSLSGVFQALQE